MIQNGTRARFCAFAETAFAAALLLQALPVAAQGWKPDRNVEIVVWASPGGGLDKPARAIQRIAQEKRLMDVPMSVVNKPGGSGNIGWVYMNQNTGNGHYLSLTGTVLITNLINGVGTLAYTDATPVALLAHDYLIFAVKNDSPIKTGRDLIERLKKDPASVSLGITNRGGAGHIAMGTALRGTGVDAKRLKIVVFKSGAEGVTALLGGHLDAIISVVPALNAHQESGGIRVLAISAPARLEGAFAKAPTWKEQGVDAVSSNWRAVVGPKGMTAPQVAYWDGFFGKLVAQPEWKKDVADSLQAFVYLPSAETKKFFDAQNEDLTSALTELGLAKTQ